jgi:small-conductance mechanosensitive channel
MLIMVQAAAIFLGLSAFYWVLFKYLSWQRTFIQPVATRVRFWVYLLIPLCTLNWVGARLYHDALAAAAIKPWLTWLPRYSITALLVIIGVESLLVLLFDYWYARRRGVSVPQIIQGFVRVLVYLLVGLLVLLNVFNLKIVAGILIGAAIILLGLGLLMQDALSNLFAGFSLQVTRFYGPGDWLCVGEHEGQVVTTDWRSLTIRTASGDLITFPLSLLARMEVINRSAEHSQHADEVEVVVDYAYPPEGVERALLAALQDIAGISAQPPAETRVLAFQAQGIRYAVKYWLTAFDQRDTVKTAVHRAIWYHFRRAAIRFALPTSEMLGQRPSPAADAASERIALLREIAFLQLLTGDQMQQVAQHLRLQLFGRGEILCRQGEPGQTFYIITRGRVQVTAQDACAREIFTQELGVGNFFGEFSLLTGEPRSATVTALEETELLVMDKEDLRQALAANAQLAEHISGILAQRRHELQESRARLPVLAGCPPTAPQSVASLQHELLRKIVSFFSY